MEAENEFWFHEQKSISLSTTRKEEINYEANEREESNKAPQADTSVDQVLSLFTVFTVIVSHRSGVRIRSRFRWDLIKIRSERWHTGFKKLSLFSYMSGVSVLWLIIFNFLTSYSEC